ncbi:MAG TPA: DoxX family protein [Candidatus Absconditabacterales bacterium]|nr:DoxX family protein [Candidatus Absconditabacterales bacterium]
MLFPKTSKPLDIGLLVIRVGLGILFVIAGRPKITGGTQMRAWLGGNMSLIGITFWPVFRGFMAAFAEFVGGILVILGFMKRPAAFLIAFTMFIATLMHLSTVPAESNILDLIKASQLTLALLIVFAGLMITGPGKISLDYIVFGNKTGK